MQAFSIALERLHEFKRKPCPCLVNAPIVKNLCPCDEFTKYGKCRCGVFRVVKQ